MYLKFSYDYDILLFEMSWNEEISRKYGGQRVRKARKEKGYTQTELVNILGKASCTIQNYDQWKD